ncbi:MAG: hypothetical protein XD95_0286 [Microgenomates bacterium 39_7]|nr:MAG: hypothetical protein XD95_0286 [Microgenomates bacterium 39_7]
MVISGTLALIATTISIFGAVNTGANMAGSYHDKQMIQDSLNNMKATEQLLRQKANDSSGLKQQEMLVTADKLGRVNSKMTELNNQVFTNSMKRESLGFAKGLITGKAAGAAGIAKVAENLMGIGDAAADQVIGNNGLQGTLNNMAMQDWNAAADAGDELDVQILILQARELTRRTKALDNDMQRLQQWYQQEPPGNTDSSEIDQQTAELVDSDAELAQQLVDQAQLKGQDSVQPDIAADTSQDDAQPDSQSVEDQTPANQSVVGTWVGTDKRLEFETGALNGTDANGNVVEKVLYFKEGGVLDREDKPLGGGVDYSWEQVDANHVKTIAVYDTLQYEITYKLEGDQLISTKVFAEFNGEASENNDVYGHQILKRK